MAAGLQDTSTATLGNSLRQQGQYRWRDVSLTTPALILLKTGNGFILF
jgi:hypothetical protein